jgi:hypothetical protein
MFWKFPLLGLALSLLIGGQAFSADKNADDCGWVAAGTAPTLVKTTKGVASFNGETCRADAQACAERLNKCLSAGNLADSPYWWLFTADKGLQQNVCSAQARQPPNADARPVAVGLCQQDSA